jgi:methyltransferase
MTASIGFPVSLGPLLVLLVVMIMMLGESLVSRSHERTLREHGAVEPPGDVYATMRWAYPAAFITMAGEGTLFGSPPTNVALSGAVLMAAAKALKWWAMASLGVRWTFRVLIVPGAPLVAHGPYAIWHHPNYIAVVGELIAMALLVGARVSGPMATLLFSWLIWRRMRVEDRALRY